MEAIHPLTRFREAQDPPWSRAKLAAALGVQRPTVHRWEKGERQIDKDLVPVVSEKTGIPRRELRPDWAEALEAAE